MAMERMPKVTGRAKKVRGVAKKRPIPKMASPNRGGLKTVRKTQPVGKFQPLPMVTGKAKKVKGRAMRGKPRAVRSA